MYRDPSVSLHGSLRRRLAQTTALAGLLAGAPALSQTLPNPGAIPATPNPAVVRVLSPGVATFTTTTSAVPGQPTQTLTVNLLTQRTVIDWATFDVGATQRANFTNGVALTPAIAVLNRVRGAAFNDTGVVQSQILGSLTSDPSVSVYLINPTGILFGGGSTVSVGSLIASTRNVDNTQFLNGTTPLQFAGTSTGDVTVQSGASLQANLAARGVVALIGAKVASAGTINASGNVALVAADDTTINFDNASPLSITVAAGTSLVDPDTISRPIVASGTINGSSILLVGATRSTVTQGLLDIRAAMTATRASATDQGIVLAAGPTTTLAPNITLAASAATSGNLSTTLGGTLTSLGTTGTIDIRSKDGVVAPTNPTPAATLSADQGIIVRANAGGIALGGVTSRLVSTTAFGVDLLAGAGAISAGAVSAGVPAVLPALPGSGGARASVIATAGTVTLGSLFASQSAAVSGTVVTLGTAQSEASTLGVTSTAGNLTATTLTSAGTQMLTATGGDLVVDSATSTGGTADLVVRAVNVLGRTGVGARAGLGAGQNLDFVATGSATLGTASAGGNSSLSATGIDATSLTAGGTLDATATTAGLTLGGTQSAGDQTLEGATFVNSTGTLRSTGGALGIEGGSVDIGTARAATTLDVTSTTTTLDLDVASAGTIATISANTDATLGTVDATTIDAAALGGLTATRLTATLTSATLNGLRVSANNFNVGTAEATNATARLISTGGAGTIGTLNAGVDGVLSATGIATLTGAGTVGRDLLVSGTQVRLGTAAVPGVQQAGRNASFTASTGTIQGVANNTGLTIRADALGAGTGAVILDANNGIDLTGIGLVTGLPAGTVNSGDVGIRLVGGTAPLTLGTVDARALLSVNAAHTAFSPLTIGGTLTLGATRLVNSLAISTPGTISLSSLAVSGAAQTLSVTGSGGATTVTATGTLSAPGGVTVTAPGTVQLAGVSGGTGATSVTSSNAALTVGALSGGNVSASARNALSLSSVTASGTAALTSVTAGLTASGAVQAAGNVTIDAPGTIGMADVRSTGGTVVVQSTNSAATGAITAGVVRASTGLTVARGAGIAFGSAISDNGSVSLTSTGAAVTVSAATTAATSVAVTGTSAALGAVTAFNGSAALTATTGGLTASDAIQASGAVTIDAAGTIGVNGVRSTGSSVSFVSTNGPATGTVTAGAVRAGTDVTINRAPGLTLASATADAGNVTLTSTGGTATVTGATSATGGTASVNAATVALGAVSGSIVDLRSTVGTLTAGTITGQNAVTVDAATNAILTNASSTASTLGVTAGNAITATGDFSAPGGVTVTAPGAIALGRILDPGGSGSSSPTIVESTGSTVSATAVQGASVSVRALNALTLGTVDAFNGAATLTSQTAGVTVTGGTQATGTVTVNSPGAIQMGAVRSTAAAVNFLPSNATTTLTAGAVRAATNLTIARNANVTLASATSDTGSVTLDAGAGALSVTGATSAGTSVSATGATTSFAAVTANNGTATLLSTVGGLGASGPIQASGNVTLDAPGAIAVADVRSTGGTVIFQSTSAPATGTVSAGAVRASGDLTAARAAGLTLASATSDTGAVSLSSSAGTVNVAGAVTAATSATVNATALTLGSVTATSGAALLTATTGGIAMTGASISGGNFTLDAPGAIQVGDVRSTGGTVIFRSTLLPATGAITAGAVRAAGDLTAARAAGVTFASATSDTGAIALSASAGNVAVTGATTAATNVAVSGNAVTLGAVTATGGTAGLTATAGGLTAGAVSALGAITGTASGDIALASAASTNARVALLSNGGRIDVTGTITSRDLTSVDAATSVQLASVTDTGTGASLLRARGGSLTVTGATSVGGALTASATTAVALGAVTSTGGAVTVNAGTTLNAAAVQANGAVAITAGTNAALASVTSTAASIDIGAGDTLGVAGATTAQANVTTNSGGTQTLADVTSNGGAVSLASTGSTLTAAAVTANNALTATGQTGLTLGSARSVTSTVTLGAAAGPLSVTGLTRARGNIGITARDAITLAGVTSDLGGATIASSAGTTAAGTILAAGAIDVAGAAGTTLADVTSTGSSVALRSSAGGATATGTVRANTNALVDANGAVGLATIATDTGAITIGSATGGVTATTIDAASNVDTSGQTDLTLGTVTARGGSGSLVSRAGAISVGSVTTNTTLTADAATTLAITTGAVGTGATLAGRDVTLTTFGSGTLGATARGGTLTVTAGDIRGAATLTKTGGTGEISIARLAAAGPTQITSSTAVRADLLQGGATTINAAGDVSGRTGGLGATVASLAVTAGGAATIGAITTTGTTNIAATGATTLIDAVTAGGNLIASGATVTLGAVGQTIAQTAAGQVQITSNSGAITGLAGLTLRSDSGGAGGRDATLQSAAGIAFAPGTLLAGGTDRQSAVRLAAGAGAPIALDVVEARTIASPGAATVLSQTGPVTINRLATRDATSILLTGAGNPALNVTTAEVRAGDLSLDTSGALTTGTIAVGAGVTTLAGATIDSGVINTRGLTATARSGAATLTTIDATAGGAAVTAATDIRLTRATTTGAIALTSTAGDVTGRDTGGGVFAPTVLTSSGGSVTVRANATDGTRGLVSIDSVAGAGGVDLAGRTITAATIASSAGAVTLSTRRDAAGITDQRMAIGTIDAAGNIALATGNNSVASDGSIALDRATSTGGNIAISTINGSFAARAGSPAAILAAPAGAITLDIGGNVAIGTLDTGGAAALSATGDLTADRLTLGTTLNAAANNVAITTLVAGGDASVTGTTQATITSATTPGKLTLAGGTITLTGATIGALDVAAGAGGLNLVAASVTGLADIRSTAGATIGTLTAGSARLTTAQNLVASQLTTAGTLTVTAGTDVQATNVSAGGDAAFTAGTSLTIGTITTPAALSLTAPRIDVTTLGAASLAANAGVNGAGFGNATVTGLAAITSDGSIDIGTLAAGTIDLRAATALTADLLTASNGLSISAASANVTTTRVTGGVTTITIGLDGLVLDDLITAGGLTATTTGVLTAGTIDIGGTLTATGASASFDNARVAGDAALTATAGALQVGQATVGGAATLIGATSVAATTLDIGGKLTATAPTVTIGAATARAGDIALTATAGDLQLASGTASGAVGLTSTGAATVTGPVTAGGSYNIDAASITLGSGGTARQAGADVTLTARTGAIAIQGATTVAGTGAVALTAKGAGGALNFAPDSAISSTNAGVTLATTGTATLGAITASAGDVKLDATDVTLARAVAGKTVTLTNVAASGVTRLGTPGVGNEGEFNAPTTRFDLSTTEVGLIAAPTVTIASGARDVVIGALALGANTGSTKFAISTSGRIDVLGRFVAAGSPGTRTIAIGSDATTGATPAARTSVIRVATTQTDGGRLLVDGAALELTADRIGVGIDRDLLVPIGFKSTTGIDVDRVTREYVARPTSTLYTPSAQGSPPYVDPVLVKAGTMKVTYSQYALFQNTGRPGEQNGVVLGAAGGAGITGARLRLSTPGSTNNAFALFGSIDGIASQATALLGPDRLAVETGVSPAASRINGCLIGSGGGCLNTSIAQPTLNLFDTSRAEIVRTADDLTLPFDPLIGTNNEALYLDSDALGAPSEPDCESDKSCPPKP